ncbi:hypothetical protein QYE76_001627 [Lolium multiflorum]|uniref:Zinc knuckle CX2CX4HX4C domain-containing protein n=1 Tax=Lolium multiflorum TaxID=4521 RepID=A0AAD8RN89_LOLMU|nr:hypothetical protein QYE76_001627 [Lolium multiflorum]
MFLQVQYEKMSRHCEHCGLMDHEYLECGTGEFEEDELQFGMWLKTDETLSRPGTPGMRVLRTRGRTPVVGGRGSGGYRGGRMNGAGRNFNTGRTTRRWKPRRLCSLDDQLVQERGPRWRAGLTRRGEDTDDTAASPLKKQTKVGNEENLNSEANVNRKLDMGEERVGDNQAVLPPPTWL